MTETFNISADKVSFKDFLFKNHRNRTILYLAGIAIMVQFSIFKYLYPYASFIHGDSFAYLEAADQNSIINTYLIGYSKFLRLFSVFFKSDLALTFFQYLFIQCSSLYLVFTLHYFYKLGKAVQIVILCFLIFNPLFLHLGNLISSDGLFLGLSMIWFTLLLWIIHRPSQSIILWHAIILLIAFTVRYNAMIYPFISVVGFWISKLSIKKKLIGLGLGVALCGLFVMITSYQYKKLTGYWQYSPFSGWQFANNAMYAYRYVSKSDRKPVPEKFKVLDNMIREYFDSTRDVRRFPIENLKASTVYMWDPRLTLFKFRNHLFEKDTAATELKKWATMGPFYKHYGLYIIKQYPEYFIKYFVWPNTCKYYSPPVEFLELYNSMRTTVTAQAKTWFGYKSQSVTTRMKNKKVWILNFYPILSGIINIVMLCTLTCHVILKSWNQNKSLFKGILLSALFWLSNAFFTIFASSAALRFQSFPIILTTIFSSILLSWIMQSQNKSAQNTNNPMIQQETNIQEIVSSALPIYSK